MLLSTIYEIFERINFYSLTIRKIIKLIQTEENTNKKQELRTNKLSALNMQRPRAVSVQKRKSVRPNSAYLQILADYFILLFVGNEN